MRSDKESRDLQRALVHLFPKNRRQNWGGSLFQTEARGYLRVSA